LIQEKVKLIWVGKTQNLKLWAYTPSSNFFLSNQDYIRGITCSQIT